MIPTAKDEPMQLDPRESGLHQKSGGVEMSRQSRSRPKPELLVLMIARGAQRVLAGVRLLGDQPTCPAPSQNEVRASRYGSGASKKGMWEQPGKNASVALGSRSLAIEAISGTM